MTNIKQTQQEKANLKNINEQKKENFKHFPSSVRE